jgi:hypothetical protein
MERGPLFLNKSRPFLGPTHFVVKVKVNFTLEQAMKAQKESTAITVLFL